MNKPKGISLILAACFLLITCIGYTQSVSVSPSRIFFNGNPGETATQVVTFHNASNDAVNFVGRLQDFDRDSTGAKVYYKSNELKNSNANWITLSANTITIPPGQSREVTISLTVPQNQQQPSLTNSMLFFTQVKEQKNMTTGNAVGVGINMLLEFGIQVYHSPRGLAPGDAQIVAFKDFGNILQEKDSVRNVAIKVTNPGPLNVDANVRFELTNKATGDEIKIKPHAIAMLPGASQWIHADLPTNLHGKYLVVAIVDSGTSNDLKVAQKEITYR